MNRNFFSKDFNPDATDMNIPGESDSVFQKPRICTLIGILCGRASRCSQWGTVDCHMESIPSDDEDPFELLVHKEEDPFFFAELDKEEAYEVQISLPEEVFEIGETENTSYIDKAVESFDTFRLGDERISEMIDVKIFELPKQIPIRKCTARRRA